LLVDSDHAAAGVAVESVGPTVVADTAHGVAYQPGDVDVPDGGDLPRHHDEPGGEERLAGDPPVGVVGQDGVQHGIGDLVRHLVGMALGHRLGGERVTGAHGDLLARRATTASSTARATVCLSVKPTWCSL